VFFPLAEAALPRMAAPDSITALMPFQSLAEDELSLWPRARNTRRLMEHLRGEGFLVTMGLASTGRSSPIQDTCWGSPASPCGSGASWPRAIPVDLPLLHGGAIGHDVGKFGCVGDEARRIRALH